MVLWSTVGYCWYTVGYCGVFWGTVGGTAVPCAQYPAVCRGKGGTGCTAGYPPVLFSTL